MSAPLHRPVSEIRLDGGRLCLDFANTIHDRFAREVEDYIATPERYVEWARRCGAIGAGEGTDILHGDAERERLMADVRSLRDATYLLLSACVDRVPLPRGALLVENHWLVRTRQSQSLTENGLLTLRAKPGDLRIPLKRIALDVVDTIGDARAGKLRLARCANQSTCGWIFADTSKNGRRKWCAMQTCGTLSKMATRRGKLTSAVL
jgi:predicted RNA-binding Zn ribbon-like protein